MRYLSETQKRGAGLGIIPIDEDGDYIYPIDDDNGNGSSEPMYGDVDGDGVITTHDYQLIMDAAGGKVELSEAQRERADVDGNGRIRGADAHLVGQYLIGEIDTFPAGRPAPRPTTPSEENVARASEYRNTLKAYRNLFIELRDDGRLPAETRTQINRLIERLREELRSVNNWIGWAQTAPTFDGGPEEDDSSGRTSTGR